MNHIVLYNPEIPQNTGNIMRTCAAFGFGLHLIEPLGFFLDEKHLKRSGMDYIQMIDVKLYQDFETFKAQNPGHYTYLSRYGLKHFGQWQMINDEQDIYLIFGKESTGIPKAILKNDLDNVYRLPMKDDARSLNLSNCVAIAAYECLKQQDFPNLAKQEVIKGYDWILK